jgi:hypothetical protein
MITMNTNLDTRIDPQPAFLQFLIPGPVPYKIPVTDRLTAHRQTDQRALVEIIQRPSIRAGSAIENLSVWASSAGGLKHGAVASDGRTKALREFIYKIVKIGFIKTHMLARSYKSASSKK